MDEDCTTQLALIHFHDSDLGSLQASIPKASPSAPSSTTTALCPLFGRFSLYLAKHSVCDGHPPFLIPESCIIPCRDVASTTLLARRCMWETPSCAYATQLYWCPQLFFSCSSHPLVGWIIRTGNFPTAVGRWLELHTFAIEARVL